MPLSERGASRLPPFRLLERMWGEALRLSHPREALILLASREPQPEGDLGSLTFEQTGRARLHHRLAARTCGGRRLNAPGLLP